MADTIAAPRPRVDESVPRNENVQAATTKYGAGKDRRPVLIHGQFLRVDQVDAYNRLGVLPSQSRRAVRLHAAQLLLGAADPDALKEHEPRGGLHRVAVDGRQRARRQVDSIGRLPQRARVTAVHEEAGCRRARHRAHLAEEPVDFR